MTRHALRFLAVILLSLSVRGPVARAQQAQPPPKFRTGVELITLDVSVLDRNRQPVRGLTARDFTVLEDGQPVDVQTFSAVDLPDTVVTPSAPWVRDVAPDVRRNDDLSDRRILIIVMDDALPTPIDTDFRPAVIPLARQIANEFVDRLGPHDLAAVVFPFYKLAGQDFTSDRALLHKAIARYQGGLKSAIGKEPAGAVAFRNRFVYESLTGTLASIADYLSELPNQRKALLLISEGIPMSVEDIGIRQSLSDGNDTSGDLRNVYLKIRDLFVAAQRANVTVYPIDPAGLWQYANSHKQDFLRALASNTGGFAIVDTNEIGGELDRVFRENSSYYLLGYVPSNQRAQGRFRKVQVRVGDRTLTVRTRSGYFEPESVKPSQKPVTAPPPLLTALAALMPKGDVAMQMTAAPFAVPGSKKAAVAIVVGLRQPAPPGNDRAVEDVTLRVDAYNPLGDRKGTERLTARIALRPTLSPTVAFELLARLDLPPGRYQLRAAAQSGLDARAGSVFYDLDVPDFTKGKVALSGITVSVGGGLVAAPKDGLAALLPHSPTTAREFDRDQQVTAFLRVYRPGGPAAGSVNVAVSILDGAGTPVYSRRDVLDDARFKAEGAADYPIELPLDRLKPGEHLLTVSASVAGEKVTRDLRFTVR